MPQFFDLVLFHYALSMVGLPYIIGGDDNISGYDCSGLVIELLQSAGQWPRGVDATAQGIFDHFEKGGNAAYSPSSQFGALIFYGKSVTNITHVAFGLDPYRMIEAGGGDFSTKTKEDAERQNAYVRIRPIDFRKDRVAILKPYYRTIGVI